MGNPLVACVILNTNRRDDTLACLASLKTGTYRNTLIIVLDNNSTDGSVPAIRAAFPDVGILALERNDGYAGNNNVGIQAAINEHADWLLVLNEDTILDPDCLSGLVAAGEADDRVGIVGPTVYHFDEPDVVQSAGGMLGPYWRSIHLNQNERDGGLPSAPRPVEWVSGCAIMVRRAVIEQVGTLDQRYFYYWEETEWCLRAGRAGWRILHVPAAKLWHKGVQRDYVAKPPVTYYATRNRLLTFAKHGAPIPAWLMFSLDLSRTLLSWTLKPKWRHMRAHRDAMWNGIADFLRKRWGKMPG